MTIQQAYAAPRLLDQYLVNVTPGEIVPGADSYGPIRSDLPVAPALRGNEQIGWVFLTSDFVSTTGYSGKPIHVLIGIDGSAKITGLRLVDHSEPIILIGIPEAKITAVIDRYEGFNLVGEDTAEGSGHDLDIVSGATVTIMIIDDSIMRSGFKVAKALGLGGLETTVATTGPAQQLRMDSEPVLQNWQTMTGDGSIRTLDIDVGQLNHAFTQQGDSRAIDRPEKGDASDTFINMRVALASVPSVGMSLLGEAEYVNLNKWLDDGDQAILLLGKGRYSFKGSGYVRGGIFDRIQLIQGDISVRFFDHQHRRLGELATEDSPVFKELDLFKIPADTGFDPTKSFRIQLLISRAVGAIEKTYLTFDLGYQTPDRYIETPTVQAPPLHAGDSVTGDLHAAALNDGSDQLSHLWPRIWKKRKTDVIILCVALSILTIAFFFQMQLTQSEKVTNAFRLCFLSFTVVWLGWYANAQLSVVNVLTLFSAITSDFSWHAFLMDPLIFILWFAVITTLIFWGRGGYCGWLCPFGALQELTNRFAKLIKIPQIRMPWGLHERLWAVKYILFLGLFGLSLYSLGMAERYAEIEPFKTAIILKFAREWWFVLFAITLLFIGLFVERFYCRYLCPLGAALAIPARLRLFDWLKRYRECGNPCARCANECMVQAINPLGQIEPNECHQCMHCQVLYQSETKCPVCIKRLKRRNRIPKSVEIDTQTNNTTSPIKWFPTSPTDQS